MIRAKMLVTGILETVSCSGIVIGQERRKTVYALRITRSLCRAPDSSPSDSRQQNGTSQHSTNTGGFLVNYRFHINGWLAAEASYGYNRNTQQNFTPSGNFGMQTNVHQATEER